MLPLLLPLLLHPQDPAEPFRWAEDAQPRGPVTLAAADWSGAGPLRRRAVPGWAGAATFEVLLEAPASGHPSLAERALVQVPALEDGARAAALVVAFHGLGHSEHEVFLETDLPAECARRGWVLVAPYGLVDDHFASPASQRALAVLLAELQSLAPHEARRVYAVGFSMGGLSALSFAMRHQDPRALRVAGVVCHSPTLDLEDTYQRGRDDLRRRLARRLGGTPAVAPFEYARVSPARFLPSGLVDPGAAPVVHLQGVPIFLHANLADPDAARVEQVLELRRFLAARGAQVVEDLVFAPDAGQRWGSLPLARALDLVGAHAALGVPRHMDLFADRVGHFGAVEVRTLGDARHGRLQVHLLEGEVRLGASSGLDEVALDLPLAGYDPGRPLTVHWDSADGTGDRVVLTGYRRLPARVTLAGTLAPPRSWSWDATRGELRLDLPPGEARVVRVEP